MRYWLILSLLLGLSVRAETTDRLTLHKAVHDRSEAALQEDSIAVEQADVLARNPTGYSMELRPRVNDNEAGLALRIYLPERWSRKTLSEQLVLAAESEQLRVAELEWEELMTVYRDFCDYRMLRKQQALFDGELRFLQPYLSQIDLRVEKNQFAITDRAKLYSQQLDLLNDRNQVELNLLELERRLRLALGSAARLDVMAHAAQVPLPSGVELETLIETALRHRSDYQRFAVDARAATVAEEVARASEGLRLKYLQPAYDLNYEGGANSWILSAAFVLPWGTRNPNVAVYDQQRNLALSAMSQQRTVIEEQIRVLVKSADAHTDQFARYERELKPLLVQLNNDLKELNPDQFELVRDRMLIRERILDAALQATKAAFEKERVAVELAEVLGTVQ